MSFETENRFKAIEDKLDLLIALVTKQSGLMLNKKHFCEELGIDTKTLERLYVKHNLKIPVPYRMQGVDPKFSMQDVIYMKDFLAEKAKKKCCVLTARK